MSLAELAARLQAVSDAVGNHRRQLATVIENLRRTRASFHAITATSGHRLVGEALRQQTTAGERIAEADRLLSGVPVALAEFAAAIGATVRPASTTSDVQRETTPTAPSGT